MSNAYKAVTAAGCEQSELFQYFSFADQAICQGESQCNTEQAAGCITDIYENFMSNQSTCDQVRQASTCLQNSCNALPVEASDYFTAATTMICANTKCDIRKQVQCVAGAVMSYESIEEAMAKPERACQCADSVFECAGQVTAGYIDQSLLFQVMKVAQSICTGTCNTAKATQCLTRFTDCRSKADTTQKCTTCSSIAESCASSTLCVNDDASNQIKSLIGKACPANNGSNGGSNNNGGNNSTRVGNNNDNNNNKSRDSDSSASSFVVSTTALIVIALFTF
jgi:hypothetical protein